MGRLEFCLFKIAQPGAVSYRAFVVGVRFVTLLLANITSTKV